MMTFQKGQVDVVDIQDLGRKLIQIGEPSTCLTDYMEIYRNTFQNSVVI